MWFYMGSLIVFFCSCGTLRKGEVREVEARVIRTGIDIYYYYSKIVKEKCRTVFK